MKPSAYLLRITLPLTLLFFLWVTMTGLDSEKYMTVGFPLGWHAVNQATSGSYSVALLPLAIDLSIYFLFVWWLVRLVRHKLVRWSSRLIQAISVALWLLAMPSVLISGFLLVADGWVEYVTLDMCFGANEKRVYWGCWEPRTYSLSIGLQPLQDKR